MDLMVGTAYCSGWANEQGEEACGDDDKADSDGHEGCEDEGEGITQEDDGETPQWHADLASSSDESKSVKVFAMAAYSEAGDEPRRRLHHALAVALPAQGHINPMMRFCKRLAAQEGFTITFLDIISQQRQSAAPTSDVSSNDPLHHDGKQSSTGSAVAKEGIKLDIRRIQMAMTELSPFYGGGPGVMELFSRALDSLAPQMEQLLLQPHDPPITCLISDFFMTGPSQSVADKLSLPRIALYTSCQSRLLLTNYIQEGALPLEEVFKALEASERLKVDILKRGLPGLPAVKLRDLTAYNGEHRFVYAWALQALQETKGKAHAIAINTFKEIEEAALKVNIGIPIHSVGPLVEPLENELMTGFWKEDEACMLWLDSQPCSSVLYISFGSVASLSLPQYEELVAGILSSKQRFLWVLRPNLVKDAPFSMSLEELSSKSHDKGYVTHWAPQVKVLSHPSIGGFLTHCGWNATIESISHGVPMLCFPIFGDQFFNATLIVEEWKVGLSLEENKESGLIKREEIERVIQILLVTKEGESLQQNIKFFRNACALNYSPEGHAFKNIQSIVQSLK
ncbi:hypothetical protein GOP47_0028336 [Adiantum capillus-veneris]|nr:hypothetical protein GOP47_0028336 [Adiantum capillus-veneris]